jgi:hypothetical protein
MDVEKILAMIETMQADALRVYHADRESGADAVSVGFDAGRVDAFKEVMDMVERMKK